MAFELRFGPYEPQIDEGVPEVSIEGNPCLGRKPGACMYGNKTRYQLGFEVDRQLWRAPHVGTLGMGFGLSYTRRSGPNKPVDSDQTPNTGTAVPPAAPIGQKGTLSILPMYAVGVLRVDTLARETRVPLAAYGKFGLGWALWWVNDGRGIASVPATDRQGRAVDPYEGKGSTLGFQAALGAMLLLDALEPSAGAELDNNLGVNNSYIFLEWSVSDFSDRHLDVGANTWVTGLAIEM